MSDSDEEGKSNLKMANQVSRQLEAKPKAILKTKGRRRQPLKTNLSDDEDNNTAMMTKEVTCNNKEEPLHDMTCVGIDTCSARSISCLRDDFLDLEITRKGDDQLRGIGDTKGVAGKGCLVFY
jgi:hypothetical protein